MTLLRIDASIMGPASASSELADIVTGAWAAERPGDEIVTRHLGSDPLPSDAWAHAVTAGYVPEADRSPQQTEALALANTLRSELNDADAVVLAVPLYNWGIPYQVKNWIDMVIVPGAPADRILEGKPVVLIITRGGNTSPGTPKEGWDHSTPYLRQMLADVWGADLTVIEREFTLVGVNPALDQFTEMAAELKKAAHEAAATAGKALAV